MNPMIAHSTSPSGMATSPARPARNPPRAQAMPPARAVAAALGEQAQTVKLASARSDPARLTAREREVAALIAEGLSNPDIAARLVISPRTAETHVQHIMVKLGLTARAQIAAWSAAEAGAAHRS